MSLSLVQLKTKEGTRYLAARVSGESFREVNDVASSYELAKLAISENITLEQAVSERLSDRVVDVQACADQKLVLSPIDHQDSAHLVLSGTGLTHLGSAEGRDKMHKTTGAENETDSMRMFKLGVDGGKPSDGEIGSQPEWFYKGDGSCVIASGEALPSPAFALDGSEEPEIAGIYVIDNDGCPRRLGFCLANEFSDHITEKGNYLWLAHSKLRSAALGVELVDAIPSDIRGNSKISRQGEVIWEKPFLTGEDNMSHSIANLEYHHFKYKQFRRPGDIHVHFFGTATLSFADGIRTQEGDVIEISAPPFSFPLVNSLVKESNHDAIVKAL